MATATYRCPSCNAEYHLELGILPNVELRCTNRRCDLPHAFRFYRLLEDATNQKKQLLRDTSSWSKPSVFRIGTEEGHVWVLAFFDGPVQRFDPQCIDELIDITALKGMLTGFGDEMGCTFTLIRTNNFQRIEPVSMDETLATLLCVPTERRNPLRNYAPLCLTLRKGFRDMHGDNIAHPCELFDEDVVKKIVDGVFDLKSPYPCPAGLYDFVYPITVMGHTLAALFSGQRRLNTPEGETSVQERLPDYAETCGVSLEDAIRSLNETPHISAPHIEAFKNKVKVAAERIELVAHQQYNDIRKTRDQYFIEEIGGRIRQRLDDFVSNMPRALFRILKDRIADYIGVSDVSLLYSSDPSNDAFTRFLNSESFSAQLPIAVIPSSLFTGGAADRDGVISMLPSSLKNDLKRTIAQAVPDLPPPRFLLRIVLASGKQFLFVFHAQNIDLMPIAYAPLPENHYAKRTFYDRLARVIQAECDLIERIAGQQKAIMSIMHTTHQPLGSVVRDSTHLRTNLNLDPLAAKWITNIKHTTEDAQAICGCISKVFRCLLDQGNAITQAPEIVDVNQVIRSMCRRMRLFEEDDERRFTYPHRKNLTVRFASNVRHFSVLADRETLLFVFYNLLNNAEKYSDPERHITVEYSTETTQGGRLFIKVKSFGQPISESARQQDKPFQMFWRGSRTKTGLGIGLWACRYLLERQGEGSRRGEIHLLPLDQRHPRFTVFGVRFPYVAKQDGAEMTDA